MGHAATNLAAERLLQAVETGTSEGRISVSFVTTEPEALSAAAGKLGVIGSALAAQNAAASAPTMGVVPAATDEVSVLIAAQFAMHAQMYQTVCAQATMIHQSFVKMLDLGAGSYEATEAINAAASS